MARLSDEELQQIASGDYSSGGSTRVTFECCLEDMARELLELHVKLRDAKNDVDYLRRQVVSRLEELLAAAEKVIEEAKALRNSNDAWQRDFSKWDFDRALEDYDKGVSDANR